jgi:hypothetical protein
MITNTNHFAYDLILCEIVDKNTPNATQMTDEDVHSISWENIAKQMNDVMQRNVNDNILHKTRDVVIDPEKCKNRFIELRQKSLAGSTSTSGKKFCIIPTVFQ